MAFTIAPIASIAAIAQRSLHRNVRRKVSNVSRAVSFPAQLQLDRAAVVNDILLFRPVDGGNRRNVPPSLVISKISDDVDFNEEAGLRRRKRGR